MKKSIVNTIIKKTLLTIAFPVFMFVVMTIITSVNGVSNSYLSSTMVRNVALNSSLTTIIALAIFLQFKNGRFDFSGGATMILSSIIAGNLALKLGGNPILFLIIAVLIAVILSLISASAYVYSRVPIIICTIGLTLIYESITYLVFKGEGLSIISNSSLVLFGRVPYIFIPFVLAVLLFIFYSYFTIEGRRSKLLSGNQKVSVNIGINEKKSVYVTYLFAGLLLGLGAVIYGSKNIIAPQSNLSTSGILFSYIVPVFIGMFLGSATIDAVGVVVAAIGMELMNYGLNCLGVGSGGWQQIIFGAFMLAFYAFSAQTNNIKKLIDNIKLKLESKRNNA